MSEVETRIEECIAELEQYRLFASEQVDLGVKALKEVERLLKSSNRDDFKNASIIVSHLYEGVMPYTTYLPKTVSNLKFIGDWLNKKILET